MSDEASKSPEADAGRLGRDVGRPVLKWCAFGVMWIAGLFAADVLAASGIGGTGSRLAFFGGMWMIACVGVKDCIAGYQEAKARRQDAQRSS
jgi:hypothetical protein